MSAAHNKRLPPSVCLPLMLMIGQPIRQLAALPRVQTVGSMIHFAMRKKKKERAHVREETAKTTGKLSGGAAWWIWN